MISHPLLSQQLKLHMGEKPKLSGRMARLLLAVEDTYRRMEPRAPAVVEASVIEPSLRAVFARMADGVMVRDLEDRIIEHNPAAERILSLSFDQLRGFAPLDPSVRLVREDGQPYPPEDVPSRLTLRDGKARHGVLIGWIKSGEIPRWLSFNSEPLHDSDGKVIAAVSTFSDVTEIVQIAPRTAPLNPVSRVESDGPRPTMATIARRLNVSSATVSMALHKHPRISISMQEKVRAIADELGYRPDPLLGRAMTHMRQRQNATLRSNLCALTDLPLLDSPYIAGMIGAAKARADLLGYGFSVQQVDRTKACAISLNRMLFSRGVEGLLILPMSSPWDCHDLLDWSRYSVVTASYAVRGLKFDMVASHWFASMQGTFTQLASRGYRRIGAVLNKSFDLVVNHKLTAAIASCHLHLDIATLPPFYHCAQLLSALRYTPAGIPTESSPGIANSSREHPVSDWPFARGLREWYRRECPEVLLLDCETMIPAVVDALQLSDADDIDIVILPCAPTSRFAGWEERSTKVAELAIDAIDNKIRAREKGPATTPFAKMVVGSWKDGASLKLPQRITSAPMRPCPALATQDSCNPCAAHDRCPMRPGRREAALM